MSKKEQVMSKSAFLALALVIYLLGYISGCGVIQYTPAPAPASDAATQEKA